MTDVRIEGGTLLADLDARTISGLLVPFGEEGNTNLGKFTVEKGAFRIPRDPSVVSLNIGHDREQPVARATMLAEKADGIHATFKYADTDEATEALTAYASGVRKSLSVEAKGIVIRAGKAVSGYIFGAAQVAKGAFPSATLMAADVGDIPPEVAAELLAPTEPTVTTEKTSGEFTDEFGITHKTTVTTITTVDGDTTTIKETTVIDEPGEPETEKEPPMGVVPNTLEAGAITTPRPLSVQDIGSLFASLKIGRISESEFAAKLANENGATLFAALSDVKFDGVGGLNTILSPNPQWLGKVWSATNYRQQVLPLFGHEDLTALTFTGWRWGTKPAGGDWAGNKANVPSNTLTVAAVPGTAQRYAIGHDIAREFVDFPSEGFFEGYADAVSEDYARWSDGKVAAAAIAAATVLVGDALTTLPGVAGGTIGSAASAIIDGATAIISAGSLPDFALVDPALWKQMAKMPESNVLGYLNASLGLEEGAMESFIIRPSASVAAGKVLVGCKSAATVLELPGVPIRIDALDLARGGVDKAAFGYLGVSINDALGLQLVTAATV